VANAVNYGAIPQSSHAVQKGNAGKPVGASVISKRRARKIAKQVILADASAKRAPDFEGDALGYLQAVYRGAITGDSLRMNAAAVALKFERPALAATLQATVNVEMTPEQIDRRLAELIGRAPRRKSPIPALASPITTTVIQHRQ
jgi:hypothetical protein